MKDPTKQQMADLVIYLIHQRLEIDGYTPPAEIDLSLFSFSVPSPNNTVKIANIKFLLTELKKDDEISARVGETAIRDFSFNDDETKFTVDTTTLRLLAYLGKLAKGKSLFGFGTNEKSQTIITFAKLPSKERIDGWQLHTLKCLIKNSKHIVPYEEIYKEVKKSQVKIKDDVDALYERSPDKKQIFINNLISPIRGKLDKASKKIFSLNNLSIIDNLREKRESKDAGLYCLNY